MGALDINGVKDIIFPLDFTDNLTKYILHLSINGEKGRYYKKKGVGYDTFKGVFLALFEMKVAEKQS